MSVSSLQKKTHTKTRGSSTKCTYLVRGVNLYTPWYRCARSYHVTQLPDARCVRGPMSSHGHGMAQPPAVATADQKGSEDDDLSTEIMLVGQFGVRSQKVSPMPRQSSGGCGRSLETSRMSLGAGAIHHRMDGRESEMRKAGGVTHVPGRIIATLQRKFWDSNKVMISSFMKVPVWLPVVPCSPSLTYPLLFVRRTAVLSYSFH